MKHAFIFKKAIIWAGMIFLAAMFLSSQKIYACIYGPDHGPTTTPPEESCESSSEGCLGIAVYSCANYVDLGGAWACYWHWYTCDSSCSGGGEDGEDGGPYCGNGICQEGCDVCVADCGYCCTPRCSSPYCGQGDGCGGSCSSSDAGAPSAPTLNPVDGGTVTVEEGQQAAVSWSLTMTHP